MGHNHAKLLTNIFFLRNGECFLYDETISSWAIKGLIGFKLQPWECHQRKTQNGRHDVINMRYQKFEKHDTGPCPREHVCEVLSKFSRLGCRAATDTHTHTDGHPWSILTYKNREKKQKSTLSTFLLHIFMSNSSPIWLTQLGKWPQKYRNVSCYGHFQGQRIRFLWKLFFRELSLITT